MDTLQIVRRYAHYLIDTPGTGVSMTGGDCPLAAESDGVRVDPKTLRKILAPSAKKITESMLFKLCRTMAFHTPFVEREYRRLVDTQFPMSDNGTLLGFRHDAVANQIAREIIVALDAKRPAYDPVKDNLPLPRNQLFTGREALIDRLHNTLHESHYATLSSAALNGMGGVGKTHTALEYAYLHYARYDKILWVQANGESHLRQSIAALDQVLEVEPEVTVEDRIHSVSVWLRAHPGWLMVIDNAERQSDIVMLQKYLNFGSDGALIVTTRTQEPGRVFVPLQVDLFTPEEGAMFLQRRTRKGDSAGNADAVSLSIRLGGLALALEQAGAYIAQQGMEIGDYMDLYERQAPALLQRGVDPQYGQSAYQSLSLTYMALQADAPFAASLLQSLSVASPEEIPIERLFSEHDELMLRDAIWTLRDYSLISWNESRGVASIHRVVQDVVRALMV